MRAAVSIASASSVPTWTPKRLGSSLTAWLRADLGTTPGMGAVTATGTVPPVITITGTPSAAVVALRVEATGTGVLGWPGRYTLDSTASVPVWAAFTSAATVALGASGLTLNIAVGVATADDVWTALPRVANWADTVSGSIWAFTQATAANRPALVSSVFGTLPAIRFDGVASFLESARPLSEMVTASAGMIYIAYRPITIALESGHSYSNDGILASLGSYMTMSAGSTSGYEAGEFDGAFKDVAGSALVLGAKTLVTWRHAGGVLYGRVGSAAYTSTAAGNISDVSQILRMGAGYNNTYFGNFDIAALVAVSRDLTATEDQAMRSYMTRMYSLGI